MKWLAVLAAILGALTAPAAGVSRPAQVRVAFVTSRHISAGDRDLSGLAYRGFLRAVHQLHVQGRVIEVGPAGPVAALALAARQKYDLIIAFMPWVDEVATAARRFPDSRFLMPDWRVRSLGQPPANVAGVVFRVEQGGYLVGYLAALMEKREPGRDVVASVGGFSDPGVDPFIAGYQAGARKADPGVTTLNVYAQSFLNPDKCRAAALGEIAQGAGAVFQVAGPCGVGTLTAAREKGVWGIGVDVDQSYLGPHMLTSVRKRVDVAVYAGVQRLVNGTFETGADSVFDLGNGGVGLGRISPKVPGAILARVEAVRREIVAGRIKVPELISPAAP